MEPQNGSEDKAPEAANDATGSVNPNGAGVGLQAELNAAREKATENYDLYLRARAETENTRRRAQDEIAKTQKFAIEAFAESLVPVADSLERALESAASDPATLREGVQVTLRQLQAAFERARLAEINPAGEKFDPHRHQAISTVPLASSPPGFGPNQVVSVLQKGWMIADRVLRPALVTVTQNT